MSARINKKPRKRPPNPHRERTVTDLTPLGETSFPSTFTSINTLDIELAAPSDEQLLPPSFVSPSTANLNQPNSMLPPNFGFGFNNFVSPIHSTMQQQQPFYHSQQQQNMQTTSLPPGQNDLEILENLKDTIKRGQHEFYRAIPQPQALQNVYLGPSKLPEQVNGSRENDQQHSADPVSPSRVPTNSSPATSNSASTGMNVNGPQHAGVKSANDLHPPMDSNPPATPARYDSKDNLNSRSSPANATNGPSADRTILASDRSAISASPATNGSGLDARPSGDRNVPPPLPRDPRYYDARDRDRDRDRDLRERDTYRDWERDRDRYRYGRDDGRRLSDARRPDTRHHEADFDARRRDYEDERRRLGPPDDRDRLPPRIDDRPPIRSDDRLPPRRDDRMDRPYHDDRAYSRPPLPSDGRPSVTESRPVLDPRDSRDSRPIVVAPPHGPADDRSSRPPPPSRPADLPGIPPPEHLRARPLSSSVPTSATSSEEKVLPARPPPALEERISRTPTLQERLNTPVRSEPPTRQPTLEERISGPVTASQTNIPSRSSASATPSDRDRPVTRQTDGGVSGRPDPIDPSRSSPPTSASNDRSARLLAPPGEDRGRPMDRMAPRGVTPSRPPAPVITSSRAPSVSRDDPLTRSSPTRHDVYRPLPPRDSSRDRPVVSSVRPGANSYRPDDRGYDDRRPAPLDADPRHPPDHRRFPTPTSADVYREPPRRGLSPPPRDHPPYDDRRLPPSASSGRDYYDGDRRREWNSAAEEEAYWKTRSYDRDRYDRDGHSYSHSHGPPPPLSSRNSSWEPRGEYERRNSSSIYPPPPSSRDPPGSSSISHTLSSRLSEAPSSADSRPYPTAGGGGGGGGGNGGNRYAPSAVALSATNAANAPPPPPFPRIRPRSPSPVRRSAPADDRPPVKRPRDDLYSSSGGHYSSAPAPYPRDSRDTSRDPIPVRRPEYVPRGVTPPPSNNYYDSGRIPPPPPPPSSSDRDYRRDYPPPGSYDRPRSPPRAGYSNNYRPDPRDERRFMPPPPLPR
ncbi:hypothetical protein K435DRAFT_968441 [Dendrothele bispora CBS 962.96]|uniref:Uncharacterized protein n=1 Tax=Dendrothele bispora (strain CBS 962.96) TaxID=1314807 RepID=A0A4S8LNM0_DENBC|nr:hypothetical protein K435DRAFT_968441 [Dendrothele bispora CBS 962.96]